MHLGSAAALSGKAILISATAILMLVCVLVLWSAYFIFAREAQEASFANLAAINQQSSNEIVNWRTERLGDARSSANSPFLVKALTESLDSGRRAGAEEQWRKRLDLEREAYGYNNALIADTDGTVLFSAVHHHASGLLNPATLESLLRSQKMDAALLSDFYADDDGNTALDVVAPVTNPQGLMGFIVLHAHADRMLFPILTSEPRDVEGRSKALYRDRDGSVELIFATDAGASSGADTPASVRVDGCARLASQGYRGATRCVDRNGATVLAHTQQIAPTGWLLVTKQQESIVLGPALGRALVFTAIVALSLIVLTLAAAEFIRRRQAQLAARLISTEHELESVSRLQEKTFESLKDAILIIDPRSGRVLQCNPAVLDVFGYKPEEIVDREASGLYVDRGGYAAFEAACDEVLDEGGPFHCEYQMRHKDGSIIDTEHTVMPLDTEEGGRKSVVSVVRDITERKRAEQAEALLQNQLLQAQKLEGIGRLAGGIAHDFNNMLGVILGYSESLLDSLKNDDSIREDIEHIRSAAERSAALTRQLLAFAKQQTIAPELLDLNETIRNALSMIERMIGEDIRIEWDLEERIWTVRVDPGQVDQILMNLTLNSRDAMEGGGRITIRTRNMTLDHEFCLRYPDCVPGDFVCLSIEDTGHGIDAESLTHIFEPFFSTKPHGRGTGLGMSTVYGIVKQHQGSIVVTSAVGQGTRCDIYLPRQLGTPEKSKKGPESHGRTVAGGNETILLVEDEEALKRLAQRILERAGYTVIDASNPKDAIRAAEDYEGTIHVLLTDIVMPDMNGQELWQALKSSRQELTCIFMSGYSGETVFDKELHDDVMFIQKPFSPVILLSTIRQALS